MEQQKVTDIGGLAEHEDSFARDEAQDKNWYEVRLTGKVPERRGYHSTFVVGNW